MDAVDDGIVAIISNHAWLDNATLRGMRQSLMRSFERIYIFDLHGNTNKGESTPNGGPDKNVFDIRQGVAISLFIKHPSLTRGVWRGDLWGERIEKYRELASSEIGKIEWRNLHPRSPYYLFSDLSDDNEYEKLLSLKEIFVKQSVGIVTGRDKIALHHSSRDAFEMAKTLSSGITGIIEKNLDTGDDSTE